MKKLAPTSLLSGSFFLIFFLIQKTPLVILQRKERTIHPFPFPPDAEPHRMGSRRGATGPSPKKLSWQSIWATRANGHTDLQREQKAKRNESTGKKGKIFFTKRYVWVPCLKEEESQFARVHLLYYMQLCFLNPLQPDRGG